MEVVFIIAGSGLVMNKICLLKFSKHEFKTVHKVVSWFCICILNINAQYKSVSLSVSGLCLQCVLPGFLLTMSWVIYPCWGSWERLAGNLMWGDQAGCSRGMPELLAGGLVWLEWEVAGFPRSCIGSSLGAGPCGVGESLVVDPASQHWHLDSWL